MRSIGAARSFLSVVVAMGSIIACVAPTGRQSFEQFDEVQVAWIGDAAYALLKQERPVVLDAELVHYVECVAYEVTGVVPSPTGHRWNVTVFRSEEINAFALPGGNIGVNTGILKVARTPVQLAAILGHEIAHVEAKHMTTRLSAEFPTNTAARLIGALGSENTLSRRVMASLGLGAEVGVRLPFTRMQESQADALGLRYVARAGFDPWGAIDFWQQLGKSGDSSSAFLSTHPSYGKRRERLRATLPQALDLYRESRRAPNCDPPDLIAMRNLNGVDRGDTGSGESGPPRIGRATTNRQRRFDSHDPWGLCR